MFERYFRLSGHHTSVRTEVAAGATTFLTMAYIIFVQPAVLSGAMFGHATGMDFGAVTTATCVSAALATALMGLLARYPIAQAPGMGENFFFVLSAVPAAAAAGLGAGWQVALGMVFVSGVAFLLLSVVGLRELIFNSISPAMRHGIAAGIGLFIAFIGLQSAGLILKDPGTGVKLNPHLASLDLLVFFGGLLTTAALHARRVRGFVLWGIGVATAITCLFKALLPHLPTGIRLAPEVAQSQLATRFDFAREIVAMPPALTPTLFQLDVAGALSPPMLPFVFVFLFMLTFDAIGTLAGVCERAGLMRDNRLPRARRAMVSDALGTVVGALLGTSTVTSYVESATGVEQGGRTGLTALVTAALFVTALFFGPLIAMIGSYPPITAPALIVVGTMMVQNVGRIDWSDYTEVLPAFLAMIGIPLSYSIADGLALGFIAYPALKLGSGRAREASWLAYLLALVLLIYFVFVRSRVG